MMTIDELKADPNACDAFVYGGHAIVTYKSSYGQGVCDRKRCGKFYYEGDTIYGLHPMMAQDALSGTLLFDEEVASVTCTPECARIILGN